jgi:ArsR family transcriptional regulator
MPDAGSDDTDVLYRALASRPRRDILRLLAAHARGAADCCGVSGTCACDIATMLGLGAPTVSHHMRVLRDAGLVTSHKDGLWVHYRLVVERLTAMGEEIESLALGGGGNEADISTEAPAS